MCAKIISIEQAIEMKNEYKTRIQPLIENLKGPTYKATDYAWIDLKSLKEYIATLEEVSKLNETAVSGIRLYFGSYKDSVTTDLNEGIYNNRESLFLVPTIEVDSTADLKNYINLQHVPFCINPDDVSEPNKGTIEVIEDLLHTKDVISGKETNNYVNKTSYIMNKLTLTPPPPL